MSRRALVSVAVLACLLVAAAAQAAVRAAQPLVQVDVSNDTGIQAEVAIAVDPENPDVLLAGSNSISLSAWGSLGSTYSSVDGGASWSSRPGPPAAPIRGTRYCNGGDPAVAIARGGRQYFAFLAVPCRSAARSEELEDEEIEPSLEVAARSGPGAPWRTAPVFPVRSQRFDDKPAIAVDISPSSPYADRVYVAWSRIKILRHGRRRTFRSEIVVSRSDDGGSTWSRPVVASDDPALPTTFAGVAVDRDGSVYVSWTDAARGIWIDRSTDGGAHFGREVRVDRAVGLPGHRCQGGIDMGVPAQANRCITPAPLVTIDDRPGVAERIYLTYSAPGRDGHEQDILVAAFDPTLRPLLGAPSGAAKQVNPDDGALVSDQFMPAAAVDRSTGRVWVCFYDTTGDRRRERVFYSCTASADGGVTWATPVRATAVASKVAARGLLSFFQFGDYQGLAVAGGVAHPIWTDTRDDETLSEEIYTTVLTGAELQLP